MRRHRPVGSPRARRRRTAAPQPAPPPYAAPPGWQPPPASPPPPYGAPPGWAPPPPPYGAPPGGYPQYGYPQYGYPRPQNFNGFAIAAPLVAFFLGIVPFLGGSLGVVFGVIGMRNCQRAGERGRGSSNHGDVLGGIARVVDPDHRPRDRQPSLQRRWIGTRRGAVLSAVYVLKR